MERSMSIEMGAAEPLAETASAASTPARIARGLVRAIVRFAASLQAAQTVTRRAEYYYSLNDRELARLGLTREDVPAALMRELAPDRELAA